MSFDMKGQHLLSTGNKRHIPKYFHTYSAFITYQLGLAVMLTHTEQIDTDQNIFWPQEGSPFVAALVWKLPGVCSACSAVCKRCDCDGVQDRRLAFMVAVTCSICWCGRRSSVGLASFQETLLRLFYHVLL